MTDAGGGGGGGGCCLVSSGLLLTSFDAVMLAIHVRVALVFWSLVNRVCNDRRCPNVVVLSTVEVYTL